MSEYRINEFGEVVRVDNPESSFPSKPDHLPKQRKRKSGCWYAFVVFCVLLGLLGGYILGFELDDYALGYPIGIIGAIIIVRICNRLFYK